MTAINRVGFLAGVAAATATVAYGLAQVLQLAGWLSSPVDEILIYGSSLAIVVPFLLELLALHHLTEGPRRYWSHAALIFAVIYAVFVTANYVVQLATVVPARLRGTVDAIRLLDQTPHSLFWDYDAIGYVAMGLSALCAAPAVPGPGIARTARLALMAHALVTPLIAVVYFAPAYSSGLLLLGAPWIVTAPLFMLLLARALRQRRVPAG